MPDDDVAIGPEVPGPLPLDLQSTAERVASALRSELLSGAHAPGTPMRDTELSRRAGVSRATMREALAALARQGLLVHSLHRGMEVARLDAEDLHDIYELRRVLELDGLARAMQTGRQFLAPLAAEVDAMERAASDSDYAGLVEADVRFHLFLIAQLGVRRLDDAARTAFDRLRLTLPVFDRAAMPAQQPDVHRDLLQSFGEGRRAASAALRKHLDSAEDNLRLLLAELGQTTN